MGQMKIFFPLTPCWVSGFEHQDSGVITQQSSNQQTCRDLNKSFTFIIKSLFDEKKKERSCKIVIRFLKSFILAIKFENYAFLYWSPIRLWKRTTLERKQKTPRLSSIVKIYLSITKCFYTINRANYSSSCNNWSLRGKIIIFNSYLSSIFIKIWLMLICIMHKLCLVTISRVKAQIFTSLLCFWRSLLVWCI